jgi:DNA-binding MarR family transcriptional regulator
MHYNRCIYTQNATAGDGMAKNRKIGHEVAPEALRQLGCTCFKTRRLARRLTQFYEDRMRPAGISITQFGVLGALRHWGPLPIGELAERLAVDRTTLNRTLKPLEAQGLAASDAGEDARRRAVAITEKGKAALRRAAPLWRRAQDEATRLLGAEEMIGLHAGLDEAFAALPALK